MRLRNPKAYKERDKTQTIKSLRIPLDQLKKRNAAKAERKRKASPAGGK
ncbi:MULTISPECIES: hypothetical protein [Serratia]|nr:hypothetical protein [Serratia sp. 506_PEND]HBC7419265.1 hypothetical protein [Serratia marcescens]